MLQAYPKTLRQSLLRPLFAVLTAIYRRNRDWNSPTSRADLFVVLSETAMHNVGSSSQAVSEILRRVASHCLSSGKDIALRRDLPLNAIDLDLLQLTGLVEVCR